MDVVVVACAVLLDVNACSGPCHPTTPTTYSYYIVLVSRIWGAGYVQQTHYHTATVKTPARRAKHVKLVQIVYYYCWLASSDNLLQCTYNYVFGKYFFASLHHSLREATRKPFINLVSLSQAYHFITYNRSSTHNDNEDTRWIIDHFQQNILVK